MKALQSMLVRAVEWLGALTLALLMVIVVVDVIGRGVFNKPLPWGTELLEVVLGVLIFATYPLLAMRGNHITVDLVQVGPAVQRVQRVVAGIVGAVAFAVITWAVLRQAARSAAYGDASPMLQIPTADVLWWMAAMSVLTCIGFVAGLVSRKPANAHDHALVE
ncbi:MAG TPA: TRAP transporter small permease [Ramlibacter sp.]|uniref:TRAP transporter small permease n=1 Tax=Ramlibacter sp. TaxID=1917967 RepID=UPI002BEA12F2|nr:TRAP transporter small permease [Ramlibacter sp.]HVZ44212.1 TRAP transporter small permease [Ramlibacter sp.]